MDNLQTVIDEGLKFNERRPEFKDNPYGMLTFGLMKALAECPDCAGVYRIPNNEDWDILYCPSCKKYWYKKNNLMESIPVSK